jgi:hypothetical protein
MLSGSRKTTTEAYGSSVIGDWVSGLSAASARTTPWASRCSCQSSRSLRVGTASRGRRGFAEETAVVGFVLVQRDDQLLVGSGEKSSDSAGMRAVEDGVDVEDRFIPPHAGIEVGDGECQMVQAGLGDVRHDLP